MSSPLVDRALVQEILGWLGACKDGEPTTLIVRQKPQASFRTTVSEGDTAFDVATARSSLEVRERLCEKDAKRPLVILTDVRDGDLGDDVLARVWRRRVLKPDVWAAACRLFKAHNFETSLAEMPALANLLIECAPAGGFAAAPSGYLAADRVWREVLRAHLGLDDGRPDLYSLMRWTLDPECSARWRGLDAGIRVLLEKWLDGVAGREARHVTALVSAQKAADAVPIGIVLRLLEQSGTGEATATEAVIGGRVRAQIALSAKAALTAEEVRRFADEAERVVRAQRIDDGAVERRILARADEIVGDWDLADVAATSEVLTAGFTSRVRTAAAALEAMIEQADDPESARRAAAAIADVRNHDESRRDAERPLVRFFESAEKLVRFLRAAPLRPAPRSFGEAAERYVADESFAACLQKDLVRFADAATVGEAARKILAQTAALIDEGARSYGRLLALWTELGGEAGRVLAIEDVLDRIVVPIAKITNVLLIVLDGHSWATEREIERTIEALGWGAIGPEKESLPTVVAALPTITAVSRTSLLCGKLQLGEQSVEAKAFAGHTGLAKASKATKPPQLFHKAAVRGSSGKGLSEEVRQAIGDQDQRVVGIVLNAVDDSLTKSDQIAGRWTVEEIAGLREAFESARIGKRTVVVTSDHGHVLDGGVKRVIEADGESRYRSGGASAGPDEVVLRGPRVLAPGGVVTAIVVESARYRGKRQAGYHGGAAPAETLIPLAIWAMSHEKEPKGYRFLPLRLPEWWTGEPAPISVGGVTAPMVASATMAQAIAVETNHGGLLFGETPAIWIDELLKSPTMKSRRSRYQRGVPPEETVRKFVTRLVERGGREILDGVAQATGLPPVLMKSRVAALQMLLNVDGAMCVDYDPTSETVTLNVPLLRDQFVV